MLKYLLECLKPLKLRRGRVFLRVSSQLNPSHNAHPIYMLHVPLYSRKKIVLLEKLCISGVDDRIRGRLGGDKILPKLIVNLGEGRLNDVMSNAINF